MNRISTFEPIISEDRQNMMILMLDGEFIRLVRMVIIFFSVLLQITGLSYCEDPANGSSKKNSLLDLPIEDLMKIDVGVVSSASRYNQKVTEAPANISIVSAEEIKNYGFRTVSEIINSLGGFYTTNSRDYNFTGVRGFARPGDFDTRILYLLDGHRLNEPLFSSAGTGFDAIIDVGVNAGQKRSILADEVKCQ